MTIKKTFYFDISHPDRSYDNLVPFKTETRAKAFQMAQEAYPEAYVHDKGCRGNDRRAYWRDLHHYDRKHLAQHRSSATGQFRFQHKGKKRRGMKNYPTPKRGWRKLYPPVNITWTEKLSPPYADFMKRWFEQLINPKEQTTAPASL